MIHKQGQYTFLKETKQSSWKVQSTSNYNTGEITVYPEGVRFKPAIDWQEFTLGEIMDIAVYMQRLAAIQRGDRV